MVTAVLNKTQSRQTNSLYTSILIKKGGETGNGLSRETRNQTNESIL